MRHQAFRLPPIAGAVGLALFGVLAAAPFAPAHAEATGMAAVPGADVVAIKGQRFRIHGIDAPELHQFCYVDGKPWACGSVALRALEVLVSLQPTTCKETADAPDPLGAWAVCSVGGKDIGETLVRAGMALALRPQSDRYAEAERQAREKGEGIWKAIFTEPWVFRAEMRAIETRIAARQRETVRAEVERAMTEGQGGIAILRGIEIVKGGEIAPAERATAEIAPATATPRELVVDELAAGFISRAIPNDDAFNWRDGAEEIGRWRAVAAGALHRQAVAHVWATVFERATRTVEVEDGPQFWRAVDTLAAPLRAAGRQPILLVPGELDPTYVAEWLGPQRPAGATILRKAEISSEFYLGTVNGVDVFRGPVVSGETFVLAVDQLARLRLLAGPDGQLLTATATVGVGDAPSQLLLAYRPQFEWRAGDPTRIRYPKIAVPDFPE